MKKYAKKFQDYFMQSMYKNLRRDGVKERDAIKEVSERFKAHDEGRDVIFVK